MERKCATTLGFGNTGGIFMKVTAWNNGNYQPSGAGYGVRVTYQDRQTYFNPNWQTVILDISGGSHQVPINVGKKSFWTKTCGELISIEIGKWLIQNGFGSWPKNNPPKFTLMHRGLNRFELI